MNLNGKFLSFLLSFILVACGGGSFSLDPDQAKESEINLKNDGPDLDSAEAKAFYIDNLWPIMSDENPSPTSKGCATSGCHAITTDPNVYFSVDAEDAENSWNWARVRRFELSSSDYLDLAAPNPPFLISGKMAIDHQNFLNWTDDEKALIDEWVEID